MRPWSRPRQKDGEGLKEVPPCRRRNWPAVWTGPGIEYLFIRFCMENPPFLYPWRSGVTGPLPLRKAPGLLLLDTKKPAPSQWENSDTLKHGYYTCFRKALILCGYSIADAPQKVKTCSGSFIIIQKMGRLPPKHHSAACAHRTYNPWDQLALPASPPQRMQCCSLAAPGPAARLRVSRRAHKQSMMVSLYHNIQILSMLASG